MPWMCMHRDGFIGTNAHSGPVTSVGSTDCEEKNGGILKEQKMFAFSSSIILYRGSWEQLLCLAAGDFSAQWLRWSSRGSQQCCTIGFRHHCCLPVLNLTSCRRRPLEMQACWACFELTSDGSCLVLSVSMRADDYLGNRWLSTKDAMVIRCKVVFQWQTAV